MEERQGTINDINDLYEDGYKELYLKKCDEYHDLKQLYDYEVKRNDELKEQLDACQFIIKNKDLFMSFHQLVINYSDNVLSKKNKEEGGQ